MWRRRLPHSRMKYTHFTQQFRMNISLIWIAAFSILIDTFALGHYWLRAFQYISYICLHPLSPTEQFRSIDCVRRSRIVIFLIDKETLSFPGMIYFDLIWFFLNGLGWWCRFKCVTILSTWIFMWAKQTTWIFHFYFPYISHTHTHILYKMIATSLLIVGNRPCVW